MRTLSTLNRAAIDAISTGSVYVSENFEVTAISQKLHYEVRYPNGYGISILKFTCFNGLGSTYGGRNDLWEVAVLKGDERCYDTPITDDVLPGLTDEEVADVADEVRQLR